MKRLGNSKRPLEMFLVEAFEGYDVNFTFVTLLGDYKVDSTVWTR